MTKIVWTCQSLPMPIPSDCSGFRFGSPKDGLLVKIPCTVTACYKQIIKGLTNDGFTILKRFPYSMNSVKVGLVGERPSY